MWELFWKTESCTANTLPSNKCFSPKRNKVTLISLWSRGRATWANIGRKFCPLCLVWWALQQAHHTSPSNKCFSSKNTPKNDKASLYLICHVHFMKPLNFFYTLLQMMRRTPFDMWFWFCYKLLIIKSSFLLRYLIKKNFFILFHFHNLLLIYVCKKKKIQLRVCGMKSNELFH